MNVNIKDLMQYLLAPAIVGIIILFGQFFLQPKIAKNSLQETERWQAKHQAFIDAIEIVNIQFAARPFYFGGSAITDSVNLSSPPSSKDLNRVFTQLLLYAEDRAIINAFLGSLGAREGQEIVEQREKITMIQLMREELGYKDINLNDKDVRFWMPKTNTDLKTIQNKN